ncbi:MAG: hypothetical protein A2W00_01405 [Candidatus Eisenbacteria bacterium RBG_16_71_46]|nr:MAG: hypothetical protein A2W00_01405 [Candidatus Eisenbacteria bacterium RBG_16_71_46]
MSHRAPVPITEITRTFAMLAEQISPDETEPALEPFDRQSLKRALEELRRYIPGLDPPPSPAAARALQRAAAIALDKGRGHEALARALRGLSFAPHDPGLCYLAASACFELGEAESALRLLHHTLWIHPGHPGARTDLEALSDFFEDAGGEDRAA